VGEGGGISQVSGAEYVRDEEEKRVGVRSERNTYSPKFTGDVWDNPFWTRVQVENRYKGSWP